MRVEQVTLEEWGEALPDRGFELFHHPAALRTLDEHSSWEMELYAGYKGDRPVALVPLFARSEALGRAVTSPPPSFTVPRLGPLVMPASPKRRKQEKVTGSFVEELLEEVGATASRTMFRMVCPTEFTDPRPFVWSDLALTTRFTYMLELADVTPDDVQSSFSKSLRREIRDSKDLPITVSREGIDAARAVYEQTRGRYQEQGRGFTLSWPYVRDLVEALGDRVRVYVVRDPDDEFLSGLIVPFSNDAAYYWLGGSRTTYEGTGVNSLLHWTVIEDVIEDPPVESVHAYDLMGANTERLCRYKSKFGADLVPYYTVESSGTGMNAAKKAYKLLSR